MSCNQAYEEPLGITLVEQPVEALKVTLPFSGLSGTNRPFRHTFLFH